MSEEPKDPKAPEAGGADADAAAKAEAAAKAKAEAAAKAKAAAEARAAAEAAKPAWERDPEPPEWEEAADDPLAAAIREEIGEALLSARRLGDTLTLHVRRDKIAEVAASLKERQRYTYLVDLCGVHYPDREEAEERFEVVYHAYSFDENRRVRLRVRTGEDLPVPTVTGVWRTANWLERETYDMYGVRFEGHPDMTRILMWEGFNGHPLRKDFPVEGVDTGSAIYPEYYEEEAGPIAGTGTGWKAPKPPEPPTPAEPTGE